MTKQFSCNGVRYFHQILLTYWLIDNKNETGEFNNRETNVNF